MRPLPVLLLSVLLSTVAFSAPAPGNPPGTAVSWTRWEQTLTSDRDHANPYRDVTLQVTFAGPDGQSFSGYGFWDGGRTFRVRTAFPAPGKWTWRTTCSEKTDLGLHEQSGHVIVAPYSGTNPLYRHGFLQVSANRRYLTQADGTPFFWLGDTVWGAFHQATQAEWESFLDHRAARRFTVQQVHAAHGWTRKRVLTDIEGQPAFTGKGDSLQWNPAYWQGVERKVAAANARGMVVYVCAMIEPPSWSGGAARDDREAVSLFTRQMAARLAGDFVVWSPTADDIWSPPADAFGHALKATNPRHLVIAHPRFLLEPGLVFHGKDYTDAAGLQPGAGWQANPYEKEPGKPFSAELASRWAIEWPLTLYRREPVKPILNLEGPYDGGNLQNGLPRFYAQPYPLRMPRSSAYLSFLSGALGYTYGAGGIWDWDTRTNNASGGWDFATALRASSADDMRRFAECFGSVAWWRLEPHSELIRNQPADWLHRMTFAHSAGGDLAVAYLPDNDAIELDLAGFPAKLRARWFNPASGEHADARPPVPVAGTHTFRRPAGWEDAVLLLEGSR